MIREKDSQQPVFPLTAHDIRTQVVMLVANTAVRAGSTKCETRSRAETQACCDKLSNTGPVKCEGDIGGEWCYCNKDVGTGDWD